LDLTLFLISYSAQFIYAGLFLLLFLSGLGLPFPEEMTLLTAGFLVHLEILRLYPTVITIFIGVLVGDLALYSIGWKWGKGIFTHRYMHKVFSENRLENVRQFFRDHGNKTIFIARFISGFRVAAFLAAGSMRMKPGKVLLYDFFAALVYIPLLLALAYYFGEKIQLLTDVVARVDFIVKIVLVLAGLMGLGYYLLKKKVFDAK
jgi:membrane protein DedA with SNARE-associated domain